jgi:mannose-1-phosphate guanylyltransferase
MQAVIIAGGLGTRLRPLTFTRPKPLIPLLNREMILHVLDRLPREIEDIILPVNYMIDRMRRFFTENDVGRRIQIVEEKTPLGTGGALKNVENLLGTRFLVFNGDVISSINVDEMVRCHEENGGIATLAVWKVDDPSAFGALDMREGGKIVRFVEKPEKEQAPSKCINAGVYVFERDVLRFIPGGKQVSLEREVFPRIIRKGLYGYEFEGYWADAGTLKNYIRAMKMLLTSGGSEINRSVEIKDGAKVDKPVNIGSGCTVDGSIGPNVSIGSECEIHHATIVDSALFDGVTVQKDTVIRGSIVGSGCRIGPRATLTDCIIEDGVSIKADQKITKGG